MSNKAIVFSAPKKVELISCEIPKPKAGEVLIRTLKTLISTGTELSILERDNVPEGSVWDTYGKLPYYPGYDNVGIVEAVGKGVDKSWVGKKVSSYGTHALYTVVNIAEVYPIGRDISDECAAFEAIGEIIINGVRRGGARCGDAVVIYGMGLLGQLTAQFCRICGCKPTIAVDISDYRLSKLPQNDVSLIALNSAKDNVKEAVSDLTKGRMADIVFELTGVANLIPSEFEVLRNQGTFVVLSSPRGKTAFDFHDLCNRNSYSIIGVHNMSHPSIATLDNPWSKQRDAELFFDLVADGEMSIEPLISHRAHYTKAVELYEMLMKDRSTALGVILDWEKE